VGVFSWHHLSPLFRRTGTPRKPGSPEPSASTNMREHGTPTPETVTTAVSSSFRQRGLAWGASPGRIWLARGSRYTELGECGLVTINLGGSGGQRESVDSDE
jgi:hypothetical protein